MTISSKNLLALLPSPSLSCISILICDALTDDIFQSAISLHSFRNLESLLVTRCQSVTKKGIDLFMQESNPIRLIKLDITDAITREDIKNWNDNAIWKRKNWNLNFYICITKVVHMREQELLGNILIDIFLFFPCLTLKFNKPETTCFNLSLLNIL